ncbi:sugar ABC transporter permease [Microbacterium sp. Leaf288]|uniref:carbohydrate ABC transporter permease n=1 Tax=Microbacterium sp. Leaf288 TaxID=1736323 RepID=UPI0006F99F2F|nr:carbohydrate ABC transporter permease [Microbacterium sp. Leaf288]KQP67986.1 sugar ABC transporter permease [Microbacterium sp. Leaf288]
MTPTATRLTSMRRTRRRTNTLVLIVLIAFSIVMLIPIYYLIVTTFKTTAEAAANPMGLPSSFDLSIYVDAFIRMDYPRAFLNTFIITAGSVIGVVLFASMAGYALNRKANSRIAAIAFLVLLSGLMFPYQMSILGLYEVIKSLGLMNSLLGVILINVAVNLPFATLLFYAFTSTIPRELEEAASIDGAGVLRTFATIVFPLLRPAVVTVAILNTLSAWNDFMGPLYFLQSREKQVILQEVYRNIGQFSIDWASLFPMMVLGVLPLVVFYVILQRHVIGGVAGSIKG